MQFVTKHWWKIIGVAIIYYVITYGFLMEVPKLAILNETIRNLFFHVALWFAMFILLIVSVIYAIKYLKTSDIRSDIKASEFATMGIAFGILGVATGSVWAKFTWGDWWVNDPKLNATTIRKAGSVLFIIYLLLQQPFR